MKKYLIILNHSPYANSLALESLEFALAVSAFDQQVSLLFKNQGWLQLLNNQQPDNIACKNFTKAYAGINLFGIQAVYIEEQNLFDLDLNNFIIKPQKLPTAEIRALIAAHDIVLDL